MLSRRHGLSRGWFRGHPGNLCSVSMWLHLIVQGSRLVTLSHGSFGGQFEASSHLVTKRRRPSAASSDPSQAERHETVRQADI